MDSLLDFAGVDQTQATLVSASMQAEHEKTTGQVFIGAAIQHPSGLILISDSAYPSPLGPFMPVVQSWGTRSVAVNEASESLQAVEWDITVADDGSRFFAGLVSGAYAKKLRGSPITIYSASSNPKIAASDWFPVHTGIVKSVTQKSGMLWALKVSPSDAVLTSGQGGKNIPYDQVTAQDFPHADPSALSLFVPILMGIFSSQGLTAKGAVQTLFVDTLKFWYLVAKAYVVPQSVFAAGVLVSPSAYTVIYPVVNGKLYTIIQFNASHGTSAITCDVNGLDSNNDGIVSPYVAPETNPARIVDHILTQFGFGRWGNGPWLPRSSSPCDPQTFTRLYDEFAQRMTKGAIRIADSQVSLLSKVNEWATSNFIKLFWRSTGKIAGFTFNHSWQFTELADERFVIDLTTEEAPTSLAIPYDPTSIRCRELIQYGQQPAQPPGNQQSGGYVFVAHAFDATVPELSEDTRPMPWSQGSL